VLARALEPWDRIGRWIDIGAGHERIDSVTRAFYDLGWHGVNIEPGPEAFRSLETHRVRDVNMNVAVSSLVGRARLEFPAGDDFHSARLVGEFARNFPGRSLDVATVTLTSVFELAGGGEFDFLKIDVEGHESQVIGSCDWSRYRPRIIVVESTLPHTNTMASLDWEPLLFDFGYVFTLFDGVNRFCVRGEDSELIPRVSFPATVLDDYVSIEVRDLREQVSGLKAQIDSLAAIGREHALTRVELATCLARARELGEALDAANSDAASQWRELQAVYESRSWRWTRGIRGRI
jgi:FkbM family methyltransferase